MGRRLKQISDALLGIDQSKIDQWFRDLDTQIASAEKQEAVKKKVFEAIDKGIEAKKIAEITEIPVGTIYTWIRRRRKKEEKQHA